MSRPAADATGSEQPGGSDAALVERARRGLDQVRERIEGAGGDPDKVRIVAVTKGFGVEAVRAALDLGLTDVGENYAAELVSKATELGPAAEPAPRWHYLGQIQRRKVRQLAPLVSLWQGLSRLEEGVELQRRAPGTAVLVEVETTGIAGRGGVPPAEVPALVEALRTLGLAVEGLMTVAAPGAGAAAVASFRAVAELADALDLGVRSMGMSGDLEQAIMAGTTMIRVGEALFGPRSTRPELAQ